MRVLYVGTFLSAHNPRNRSYCEDLADRIEQRGAHVIRTSMHMRRAARIADMTWTTWHRRADYDVAIVDVFSGAAFVWAEAVCLALRALRKPFVLTLHGGNLPNFARRWPRRVARLLAQASLVTAPSPYLREQMRAYRSDIELVPNAVDVMAYRYAVRSKPRPRLVWVRALHAMYNPTLAVDAVARLVRNYPDIHLRMIGPDKEDGSRAATLSRIDELGVANHVEVVGGIARADVANELESADVFLNTTDIDNTPLSILEAAAAGLCIVSTNVGGLPYLLSHDRDAVLVPPRDVDAVCSGLERVLAEPGLGERLSTHARALAEQHDWSRVLDLWQERLAEVAHA